jgi:hypothetical protein
MARPSIEGIYELGHVLYALDPDSHGFGRDDLASVERFWTFSDLHSSSAGFLFVLKDGRRVYVDLQHWHPFEQVEDFRIEVQHLENGQADPVLMRERQPPAGWSAGTAALNRIIAST